MVSKSLEGLFDGGCVMSSPSWKGRHGTNIVSSLYVGCGGQRELEYNKYEQNPSKSLQNELRERLMHTVGSLQRV